MVACPVRPRPRERPTASCTLDQPWYDGFTQVDEPGRAIAFGTQLCRRRQSQLILAFLVGDQKRCTWSRPLVCVLWRYADRQYISSLHLYGAGNYMYLFPPGVYIHFWQLHAQLCVSSTQLIQFHRSNFDINITVQMRDI